MSKPLDIKDPVKNQIYKVHPAFSFKYLIRGNYDLDSQLAAKNLKVKLLDKLRKYSQQPWTELNGLPKDNGGTEIIKYKDLKKIQVKLPKGEFYDSIDNVIIFRISSKKKGGRIVGYRSGVKKTCYILWLDWNFTSYDHGS